MAKLTLMNVPEDAACVDFGTDTDGRRRLEKWSMGMDSVYLCDKGGVMVRLDDLRAAIADPSKWQGNRFVAGKNLSVSVITLDREEPVVLVEEFFFEGKPGNTFKHAVSESSASGVTDLVITLPHELLNDLNNWRSDPA